jgi:hypothetical protein
MPARRCSVSGCASWSWRSFADVNARAETSDRCQPPLTACAEDVVAAPPQLRRHGHRRPDIDRRGRIGTDEPFGRNADDGERVTIERDRLADDVGAAAEQPSPGGMTDDRDGRFTGRAIVTRKEQAAAMRLDPHHLEIVAGDQFRDNDAVIAGRAKRQRCDARSREPVEDGIALAEVEVLRV